MTDNNKQRMSSHPKEEGEARKKAKIDNDENDFMANALDLYRALDDDLTHLNELVKLIESSPIQPFQKPLSSIQSLSDMIGILSSVVYCQMASTAIEGFLNGDKSMNPQHFIDKSLNFFPRNAACWSMGANFGRITETLSKESVTQWYERAAEYAQQLRRETLDLLESERVNDSIKEWMELLLLQQITGVEYMMEDEGHEENEEGQFSSSSVEGTSRFMAAILLSRDGRHDDALHHLKFFSQTHRLHPNVWTGRGDSVGATTTTTGSMAPVSFQNVLPPKLYKQMCTVFGPDAVFWKESDYDNQGYYSFLVDIDSKIKNLIDDVVIHHLLPLAKQVLGEKGEDFCAYEWWTHSRQASLGHTLHFDTDEASLEPGETVHHPLLSSVLYLTGDETSGATILLDQTPDSDSAKRCWRSIPYPNTFMVFPGDLLHGVLPCSGTRTSKTDAAKPPNKSGQWMETPFPSTTNRRLTFMVGFKARSVPDQRRGKTLYGPCAPLPAATEEWVKEIQNGYNEPYSNVTQEARQENIHMKELPCISPAWEHIVKDNDDVYDPPLELPQGIDHRFFVNGDPSECFRSSLFEHDEVP